MEEAAVEGNKSKDGVVICTVQNDHDYVQAEPEPEVESVELFYQQNESEENHGDKVLVEDGSVFQVVDGEELSDQVQLVLHNLKEKHNIVIDDAEHVSNLCLVIKDEVEDVDESGEREGDAEEAVEDEEDKDDGIDYVASNDFWWAESAGPPYNCKLCKAKFEGNYSLFKEHVESHCTIRSPEKNEKIGGVPVRPPYLIKRPCNICGKKFTNSIELASHMITHKVCEIHICDVCDMSYFSPAAYKAHMLRDHLIELEEEDEGSTITLAARRTDRTFRERLHKCNICGEEFEISTMLDMHKKQKHEISTYKCELCDHKEFHSYWEFQRHSALHNMDHRIACEICDRSFASKGSLYCHMLLHGEKKHECDKCGKKFALKTALKNHLRQHSDERPFKCSICGKGFKTYTIHRAHFLTHIGVKPYKCDVCARLFAQKQQLIAHSRTHTGEKPFICPYCGVSFALNGNLTVHKRRHTGEMPYICEYCQKGFYDTSSRKKHMKKCCQ